MSNTVRKRVSEREKEKVQSHRQTQLNQKRTERQTGKVDETETETFMGNTTTAAAAAETKRGGGHCTTSLSLSLLKVSLNDDDDM